MKTFVGMSMLMEWVKMSDLKQHGITNLQYEEQEEGFVVSCLLHKGKKNFLLLSVTTVQCLCLITFWMPRCYEACTWGCMFFLHTEVTLLQCICILA